MAEGDGRRGAALRPPDVLDVQVDPDERVYPVAKPGAAAAEMFEHGRGG